MIQRQCQRRSVIPAPASTTAAQPGSNALSAVDAPRAFPAFRPEIEGLRAVAVVLVMIFHIWEGRVSGGVDVFLVISAFLLTASFTRRFEAGQPARLGGYWLRTFTRLLPPLALMLVVLAVVVLTLYPPSRQESLTGHLWASAGYVLNWVLAAQSVDYYEGSGVLSSPVQHVWSLSVQGQVFVLWPLVLLLCALAARRFGLTVRRVATVAFAAIFVASLWHSIAATAASPEFTYFDATARWWEFAAGSLVALLVTRPARGRAGDVVGWLGLALVVGCALWAGPDARFPGWISLIPVLGACLVLAGTATGHRSNVDRVLSWRPLVWIGRHSYGLYLWHWPLLITYLLRSATDTVSVPVGLGIMAASLALTLLGQRVVRGLMPVRGEPVRRTARRFVAVALGVVLALGGTTGWLGVRDARQAATPVTEENYPGAAALFGADAASNLPPVPSAGERDREWVQPGPACGPGQRPNGFPERAECYVYTPPHASGDEPTLVLLGDSHARQFAEPLTTIAEQRGWRVVSYLMMACRYGGDSPARDDECNRFNRAARAATLAAHPDGVVLIGTESEAEPEHFDGPTERVVPQLAGGINPLSRAGIPVLALRDNPRFDLDMYECVEIFGRNHPRCNPTRETVLAEHNPLDAFVADRPQVATVDLSDLYCPDGRCPAVIGNMAVYLDRDHVTATYGASMAPFIGDQFADTWAELGGPEP